MKILPLVVASVTIAIAFGCSRGSSAPATKTAEPQSSVQAYFDAVDAAFRDTINPAAVDPSSPNSAAPVRNALQRLTDIHPPSSIKDLHEQLIKAGEAYANAVDAIQTQVPTGAIPDGATEVPVGLKRAVVDAQRAEADLAEVCIDLEQTAKANDATFTACGGGSTQTTASCIDYGEGPLTSATPGPLDGARQAAESIAGHPLPIPRDLPPWVTQARGGRAVLRPGAPEHTGVATPMASATSVQRDILDSGAAITFIAGEPGHPEVTLTFGPPDPCGRSAYAEQRITAGATSATVRFVVSYGSRSSITSPQKDYVALAASFNSLSGGVVIRLEWDRSSPPDQGEQVAQATDWVKRVLAAE